MKQPKVTRAFLNPKEGMAAIQCRTFVSKPYHECDDNWGGSADCNLSLSDCGRQITLDFDAYNENYTKERLAKIDKIRAALNQIEDALIEHYFNAGVLTKRERNEVRKAREADTDGKNRPHLILEDDYL